MISPADPDADATRTTAIGGIPPLGRLAYLSICNPRTTDRVEILSYRSSTPAKTRPRNI